MEFLKGEMRRGRRRMWWVVVVPCTSRKCLRTDSRKDIEEILKTKLATIKEEPEMCDDHQNQNRALSNHLHAVKKGKKMISSKIKIGRFFMPQFSVKDSYFLFMNGVAPKGRPAGLPQP